MPCCEGYLQMSFSQRPLKVVSQLVYCGWFSKEPRSRREEAYSSQAFLRDEDTAPGEFDPEDKTAERQQRPGGSRSGSVPVSGPPPCP